MRILRSIILALWLLLVDHGAARADPISISILTIVGIEATVAAVAVTTFALSVGASIGLSYLQTLLNKKNTQDANPVGGSSGQLSAGGVVPRSFIVGYGMTGGSLAYANTFRQVGQTPNALFTQVISLSDIPVTGLTELWVNGARVTYDAEAAPGEFGIVIPEFTVSGFACLWVRFYDGRQTQADAQLVALFGNDPDRPYTDRRVGQGIAYAIVTALVNPELFASFPQYKFVLAGAPLYDRRFDGTAGGSGAQRWADPSTWSFTENVAVIRENILRGIRYAGAWQWGAQTIGDAQLPAASWMSAANECDAPIALAAGGTEPQFRAGGEIRYDIAPADVIDELNKADNGRLAEIGGVYKTRSGAAGAAVFSFTDRDILSDQPQTYEPFASLSAQVNHVTARYLSAAEGWNLKDAPALADVDLETLDGRRLSTQASYGFVTSGTQVQRLMRSERDQARAWRRHALPMPPDTFVLEPLDVVSWTSTRNGYVTKTFEVVSAEDQPSLNMGLALKELDPAAYDWNPAIHERPISEGTIAIVRPEPQPIVAWFADPYTLISGGRGRAAILLGWDASVSDVDGIRFEVRLKATGELQLSGEEGAQVFARGELIVSHNLLAATQYQARGQYRPASPRKVEWSSWLDVTTHDVRLQQAELSNALDAKLRQATEQVPRLLGQFRREADQIVAAVHSQLATVRETAGRTLQAVGVRYVSVRSDLTDVTKPGGTIASAKAEAIATALADAQGALAAFAATLDAIYATDTSVSTARAEAISTAASNATSAIAAFAATLDATYATDASVSTAKAEAISTAASNAISAIASFAATLDATYATDTSVSTAKAEAISSAASNATSAIAAFAATLDATYATDDSVSTAKADAISAAGSNATSAIAAFAATLDATFATDNLGREFEERGDFRSRVECDIRHRGVRRDTRRDLCNRYLGREREERGYHGGRRGGR